MILHFFQKVQSGRFKHALGLLPCHAGKIIQERGQRIPRAQMVEKTLDRNSGPAKNRLATQAVGILLHILSKGYSRVGIGLQFKRH